MRRELDSDDAVLAIALQRYIITRLQNGERVTLLAATRIVDIGRSIGLAPRSHVQALGFPVTHTLVRPMHQEHLVAAWQLARQQNRLVDIHRLCNRFLHCTVQELERGPRLHVVAS